VQEGQELRSSIRGSRIEEQHKSRKFMNGRTTQKQLKKYTWNINVTTHPQHEAHMHSREVLVQ
jgi:DUF4097 and DUF4098 domain-containing protein YvlB